jgi:hypothetical protein
MSKLTPRDSTKPPLTDRVNADRWQYWFVRVVPMLYVTTFTIVLPKILTQSFVVSELGSASEQKLRQQLRAISIKVIAHGETIGSGVLLDSTNQQRSGGAGSPAATALDRVYTAITNAHVIQSTISTPNS